jgi:hypothetical protein
MSWTELATVVASFGTVVSAIGVAIIATQLRDGRRFIKASLINELEREYRGLYSTYSRLLPDGPWSPSGPGPATPDDFAALEAYLEFFEKIAIILDTSALDLVTVDRLYGYRFFLALNNPHAAALIRRDAGYWVALEDLYQRWAGYREARQLPTVNDEHKRCLAHATSDDRI